MYHNRINLLALRTQMMKQRPLSIILLFIIVSTTILTACGGPPPQAAGTPVASSAGEASPVASSSPAPDTQPAATASATAPTAQDKRGGRLVLNDGSGTPVLDPFRATWHTTPIFSVFDTLMSYSPDLASFVPGLAEKWEVSPDKLALTIHLRKDVTFHDGTPLNAQALKWNFDRYRDKSIGSSQSGVLSGLVTDVQTPDEYTVVLKLNSPYAPLFDFLSSLEIVSPTAYEQAGKDKFGQNPIGAGKWKIKEFVPNDHLLFTRNEEYAWGPSYVDNKGPQYPDELEFKSITDPATIYATLETGEVHIAPVLGQFVKKARENPNIELVEGVNIGLDYIGFNNKHPLFENKNIRRAIAYAINREELVMAGYEGEAVEVFGPLSPTEFGYSEAVEQKAREQGHDPEKAKQALAAEGWQDSDGDGILDKAGQKLEFRLSFQVLDSYKRMAETIQAQLGDVGIKVNLEGKDIAALREETASGKHEMFLLYFGLIDPRILCYMFCSGNIGGTNRMNYANPQLDKLLAEADAELDPTERKKKVAAAMEVLVEERPHIPLLAVRFFMGYRKDKIAGLKFGKVGSMMLNDVYLLDK
jgi:peptide/nickel transport system substrate-binding protein